MFEYLKNTLQPQETTYNNLDSTMEESEETDTQCILCDSEVGSIKRKRSDVKFRKLSRTMSLGSFNMTHLFDSYLLNLIHPSSYPRWIGMDGHGWI